MAFLPSRVPKLFFLAVETIFWWNPLAHFSREEITTLIELHCDAKVVAEMDERERYEYAALLRKLMDLYDPRKRPVPVSSLVGGEEQMNQRITMLIQLSDDHSPRYIAFALLALFFVLSYFAVVQPARLPPDETDGLYGDDTGKTVSYISADDIPNVESQIVFENGEYKLYLDGKYVAVLYEEELSKILDNTIPIIGGE